jgi:signal transduction histidine kinase
MLEFAATYLPGPLLVTVVWAFSLRLATSHRRPNRGSRARAAAAAYAERRRVVRDLHDGAQQRLVHTIVTLKLARQGFEAQDPSAHVLVDEALGHAQAAHRELRELVNGTAPSVLRRGGLAAGVQALAARAPVPVAVDVSVGPLPSAVEAAAYFVVAESLTNIAKHAQASTARVAAWLDAGVLRTEIRDDGVGGADPKGSGLVGLRDRVAELEGELEIATAPGTGTCLAAAIPLAH